MKTQRKLIIVSILVIALGLLTVSLAFAGQGNTVDSLASVTGTTANPSGESSVVPNVGGTLLLDQPPNQTNGLFSDPDCDFCGGGAQSIAENFILAGTYEIQNLVLWGGYFPGNSPANNVFSVLFHNNNAGLPSTNISSESNVPASSTSTGVVLFGVNEWMTVLTLTTPVNLNAGTYWVEIFNDTTGSTDSYFWEVGNQDLTNGILNNAFALQAPGVTWLTGNPVADVALQIYGNPPPAPAIEVSKTPATQTIVTGGNADFTITVTNSGDVDLDSVTVVDPLVPACDSAIGTLTAGAVNSYSCTDVGVAASYTNVVTVTSIFGSVPGPSASASAAVTVVPPTSVSLSGFGSDSAAFSPVWLVALLAVVVGFGFAIRRKMTA